jgi:tetratricopeptide (TPR) repeat protein
MIRDGADSPAILIDNATAANRAVNIPEFVNIPPDGLMKIDVPAAESYRLFDVASDLTAEGYLEESIAAWKKVLEVDPRNAKAHNNLGLALMWQGNLVEGAAQIQMAREIDPSFGETPSDFGVTFFNREQFRAAMQKSDCDGVISYGKKILAVAPRDAGVKKSGRKL